MTNMTATLPGVTAGGAVACVLCAREAFFQARVEWAAGRERIRRRANACASHVIEAIQLLRAWGHDSEYAGGWLTVLAIDPYALPRLAALGIADPGFIFYSARLTTHGAARQHEEVGGNG
jgi:hypothetical protein